MNEAVIALPLNLLHRVVRAVTTHTNKEPRFSVVYFSSKYVSSTNGHSAAAWFPDPNALTNLENADNEYPYYKFYGDEVLLGSRQLMDGITHVAKLYRASSPSTRKVSIDRIDRMATIVTNQSFFSISIDDLSSSGTTRRQDDFPSQPLQQYFSKAREVDNLPYALTGWSPEVLTSVASTFHEYDRRLPITMDWRGPMSASFFWTKDHEGRMVVLAIPARI